MLQNLAKIKDSEKFRRLLAEACVLLGFMAEIHTIQLRAGRHFLHEHPLGATSWGERVVKDLARRPQVKTVIADICRFGLTAPSADGGRLPARKRTRFMSSSPAVLEQLARKCRGDHQHQRLHQSRPAASAIYPAALCRAILRGAEQQRKQDGFPLPAAIEQLRATGLGVFALRHGAENDDESLEVDETVLDMEVEDEEDALLSHGGQATVVPQAKVRTRSSPGPCGDVEPRALRGSTARLP